jgi:hypothetical protein
MFHVMAWRMLVLAALVFASGFTMRLAWESLEEPRVAEAQSPAEGDLNRTKADAVHWLTSPEYATLLHRLENAHAANEAALIEARRRVRLNEGRDR